jgi:hypothetical protein
MFNSGGGLSSVSNPTDRLSYRGRP